MAHVIDDTECIVENARMGIRGKMKRTQLPRDILAGDGVLEEVGEVCRRLSLDGVALVVAGRRTKEIAGKRVLQILEDASYDVQVAEIHAEEADRESVERVKSILRETKARFLISVGGGKIIDIGKVSSFEMEIPFVSVPTIASHDGIASPRATIRNGKFPMSVQTHAPLAVVADTEIIARAPFRFTAAGCGDIVANFTAVLDWKLAYRLRNQEFSSYAAALSEMTANMVLENAKEIRKGSEIAAWLVTKALISSGVAISIAGTSAPASGSEHKFSHALDIIADRPALHGEQCGIGTIMMAYLHGEDWQLIKNVLREIGAPTTAKEIGVPDEIIIEALTQAHKINPHRYTILGDTGLTREAAERLARVTGVID
ncbi:MAG: NAD(P)-dependent glycerol-1-phosphate dehydrogenase [Canidatus Methanoxibalbensis ujae]|nr:NAD(P)-dependent glycerol-1-phosphate dehydrogenase [Candidatus Methanoxibalbensis ujae]MCW7079069.1 NAD(P)-dependent glycerol-1-phosphate dehydrogenase [Candidatus Methanoxibalbensis ujae]